MTKNDSDPDLLQKAYEEALTTLLQCDPASEEYGTVLKRVQALEALLGHTKTEPWRPTADTVVKTAGLVGTSLIIVAWESRNAWTTKAAPFLMKFF